MKNKTLKIFAVLAVFIIITCVLFIIDYFRVKDSNEPLFTIKRGNVYYGLGYKVYYYEGGQKPYEIGTYFLKYDDNISPKGINISYTAESVVSNIEYNVVKPNTVFIIGDLKTAEHIGFNTISEYVANLTENFFDTNVIIVVLNNNDFYTKYDVTKIIKDQESHELSISIKENSTQETGKFTCFTFINIERKILGNLANINILEK